MNLKFLAREIVCALCCTHGGNMTPHQRFDYVEQKLKELLKAYEKERDKRISKEIEEWSYGK